MASEMYEAALEIRGAINHLSDLIEGDVFPERIADALQGIERELGIANQLTAYAMMAGKTDRDVRQEIRDIIAGQQVV